MPPEVEGLGHLGPCGMTAQIARDFQMGADPSGVSEGHAVVLMDLLAHVFASRFLFTFWLLYFASRFLCRSFRRPRDWLTFSLHVWLLYICASRFWVISAGTPRALSRRSVLTPGWKLSLRVHKQSARPDLLCDAIAWSRFDRSLVL